MPRTNVHHLKKQRIQGKNENTRFLPRDLQNGLLFHFLTNFDLHNYQLTCKYNQFITKQQLGTRLSDAKLGAQRDMHNIYAIFSDERDEQYDNEPDFDILEHEYLKHVFRFDWDLSDRSKMLNDLFTVETRNGIEIIFDVVQEGCFADHACQSDWQQVLDFIVDGDGESLIDPSFLEVLDDGNLEYGFIWENIHVIGPAWLRLNEPDDWKRIGWKVAMWKRQERKSVAKQLLDWLQLQEGQVIKNMLQKSRNFTDDQDREQLKQIWMHAENVLKYF